MNYKINIKCELKNVSEDNIEMLKKEYLELNSLYVKQFAEICPSKWLTPTNGLLFANAKPFA